jgi:L-2,4-diaminobutyrate decarboxylase
MNIPNRIQSAYDPESFRQHAHELVDFLADRLSDSQDPNGNQLTTEFIPPQDALEKLANLSGDQFFQNVWQDCIRLHNPKFMGHQIMPPVPISALAGLFSDFVNNGMGVYEMGVAGTTLERIVVKQVGERLGLGADSDGVMTCGGSLANLTAMLAARSHCSSANDWTDGTRQKLALMVSDQSHYCVDRAARIMGWGSEGIIKIPTDDQFRMKTELLSDHLQEAKTRGLSPIAIVGSACTTSTGSFDDLQAIGEFCQAHGLWFHVDGAHGAANAFSNKYRSLVQGIELADSVTLDFHKMLMTPAITSALIFRDGRKSYGSFAQQAEYLWTESDSTEWFNLARRTFECTKTMLSLKVYSIIATHGWELFDENVTRLNDLAKRFAEMLDGSDDFELATQPQTNIVCFRYRERSHQGPEELNTLNNSIRKRILDSGEYYIVQTALNGEVWLRTTISNPMTQEVHLAGLMKVIRELAVTSSEV